MNQSQSSQQASLVNRMARGVRSLFSRPAATPAFDRTYPPADIDLAWEELQDLAQTSDPARKA